MSAAPSPLQVRPLLDFQLVANGYCICKTKFMEQGAAAARAQPTAVSSSSQHQEAAASSCLCEQSHQSTLPVIGAVLRQALQVPVLSLNW